MSNLTNTPNQRRWQEMIFLAMLAACPPLSTDMYLPAIPTIAEDWQVSLSTVNLSLVLWFVGFSVALLISGPLSDRHGRKPVLLGGLALFTLASLGSALSPNVYVLITCRILQGIGSGGPSAMCLAICRDRYEGLQRKKVLATVSVLLTLAPMLSPSIGTLMLSQFQWQAIFYLQAGFGVLLIFLSIFQRESAEQTIDTPLFKLLGRYGKLMGNRNYIRSTVALGILIGPYLGYVAIAPIVYINLFGLSEGWFSFFFAFNAILYMIGAMCSTRVSHHVGDHHLLTACIIGTVIGGIGIICIGHLSPWTFALTMGTITSCFGMTRPISQHIILEQVQTDVGAASSMLVFFQFIVGAICMTLAGLAWPSPIMVFGIMAVSFAIVVLCMWLAIKKQLHNHENLEPENQEPPEIEAC
ncbi:MAG: multidrug effflux MFS transporter [Phycisphaeraceae bacterium JB051]